MADSIKCNESNETVVESNTKKEESKTNTVDDCESKSNIKNTTSSSPSDTSASANSSNIKQVDEITQASDHEFLQPALPIKFKKPFVIKKANAVSNNSQTKTDDHEEKTEDIDMELDGTQSDSSMKQLKEKALTDSKGIKFIPVPYKEPSWSGTSSSSYSFEVLKGGVVVDKVTIDKPFIVFGRLAQCDVMLEHPSISRFHCVVQYRSTGTETEPEGLYVYDLSSTHGTFQNKHRLQPKQYNRIQVGHMIKLGGSTRTFLLLGPSEDAEQESPLSVKELQELAWKKQQDKKSREEEKALEKIKKEEQRIKEEDERGISWGMGEDATEVEDDNEDDPENCAPNPFSGLVKEELHLDDPKKTLRGWYEREGYDLPEYDVTEVTSGRFKCTVRLPVLSSTGEPLIASVDHKGKKKDTVLQAALEACRLLDKHELLRQATHAAHVRHETANYDSDDEDEFLDRTGDVARKKAVRGFIGRKKDKTLTFGELSDQHNTVTAELQELCGRLMEVQKLVSEAKHNADAAATEDLDVFMRAISKQMPDKHKVLTWKLRCIELRKEEARLRRLVNIARPYNLPEITAPTLPDGLVLPGLQNNKDAKKSSLSSRFAGASVIAAAASSSKKSNTTTSSSGVHAAFLEDDEAPKVKLSRLDSSDDNLVKAVPYDKRLYKETGAMSRRLNCGGGSVLSSRPRPLAKYIVWNDDSAAAAVSSSSAGVAVAFSTTKDTTTSTTITAAASTTTVAAASITSTTAAAASTTIVGDASSTSTVASNAATDFNTTVYADNSNNNTTTEGFSGIRNSSSNSNDSGSRLNIDINSNNSVVIEHKSSSVNCESSNDNTDNSNRNIDNEINERNLKNTTNSENTTTSEKSTTSKMNTTTLESMITSKSNNTSESRTILGNTSTAESATSSNNSTDESNNHIKEGSNSIIDDCTAAEEVKKSSFYLCDMNSEFVVSNKNRRKNSNDSVPKLPSQLQLVRAAAKRSTADGEREVRSKKKKKLETSPLEFNDPRAEEDWVPPVGQTGDGRTHLNDKLGY